MNLSDNYPAGCNESMVNRHFGSSFNDWYEQHEDYLLEKFIDTFQDVVVIPAVKDWPSALIVMWSNWVDREYHSYLRLTEEYEPD